MSLIKKFVTKHIHAAAATHPSGLAPVAVFFYGAAPDAETIRSLAATHGAEATLSESEGKLRITATWADVNIMISIDPAWDKAAQMQGMRGWAERFPKRVRELPDVAALIASFDTITACYGSVSRPGLDADNKAINLLLALLGEGGGFFFSRNSFYGTDRLRITGFDEDPTWLGSPSAA